MTDPEGMRWSALPTDRVVRLCGASPRAVELALDPLPDEAPAIVVYRAPPVVSLSATVDTLLGQLDVMARDIFPLWLPDAEGIEADVGGIAAVRALALRKAYGSAHFAPFLVDLAVRSVGGPPLPDPFIAELRAEGLARVITESYGRRRMALVVSGPDQITPQEAGMFVAACEWLALHAHIGIWLNGPVWQVVTRVAAVSVVVGPESDGPDVDVPAIKTPPVALYPAIRGQPKPGSSTERRLEAALRMRPWAAGRRWNEPYQPRPLAPRYIVDLMWTDERCVVEIDGNEHRGIRAFTDDHRRDVFLQLDGYAVLRFTNDQIRDDLVLVLSQIEEFLSRRRLERQMAL